MIESLLTDDELRRLAVISDQSTTPWAADQLRVLRRLLPAAVATLEAIRREERNENPRARVARDLFQQVLDQRNDARGERDGANVRAKMFEERVRKLEKANSDLIFENHELRTKLDQKEGLEACDESKADKRRRLIVESVLMAIRLDRAHVDPPESVLDRCAEDADQFVKFRRSRKRGT